MRFTFLFVFCFVQTIFCEDYYDILGIQKDAENREIRKAFKKLALKYHPDKNQDKDAHENFLAINKAYEVLKDEEMRKKYDLYGEEGLKEDFGKSWQGNYHSWNYYYESFGIYDDDPEIITLSRNDFDRSVLDSPDIWFVNFYSPQCSHCHHLAPAWRKLARELQGVIHIGAVNCEEDWILCRQQNIFSYPSLMIYPQRRKYQGSREADDMIEYVLKILPYNVIKLTPQNYVEEIGSREFMPRPWLIFSCMESNKCFPTEDLKKLGVILDHLVYLAELDVKEDKEKFCNVIMPCDSPIMYFENLSGNISVGELKGVPIDELDTPEIVSKVLHLLPEPLEISKQDLEEIKKKLEDKNGIQWLIKFVEDSSSSQDLLEVKKKIQDMSVSWLIKFVKDEESSFKRDIDLKRLKSHVPEVLLGYFNCYHQESTCKSLHIVKYPTFLLFRPDGSYEFHYGGTTAFDVTRFAREVLSSRVHTLNPEHFPTVTQSKELLWFIDFFAPWCPPCMQFLPEWRKASVSSNPLVKFGTVDCSVHSQLCRRYNINSYPSAILYKQSVGHKFHGSHSEIHLAEFIEDILNPVVISLSPKSFEEEVKNKDVNDAWVIDFFAPWCGPCQQLAPQYRKFAKGVANFPNIHVGEVDCEAHQYFCNSVGVNSYPTIRLYPSGTSTNRVHTYSGWSRDALSLQAWVLNFMPSKVQSLTDIDFQNVLADEKPWVIDFYAPWCSHCQIFAPEFEKIAKEIEGKVKAGKVNCDQLPRICRLASIRAYPTVLFYRGQSGSNPQNPAAEEIHTVTYNGIISFLESKLNLRFQKSPVRDEL